MLIVEKFSKEKFYTWGSKLSKEAKQIDCGSSLHTYIHNLIKIFYYSIGNFYNHKIENHLIQFLRGQN